MGAPIHGFNGLIYIGGTELTGANAWNVAITKESAEAPQFGDAWKKRTMGQNDWSGSISAWEQEDEQIIATAATATTVTALLIYPSRSDLTNYYSGDAIFGMNSDGSTGSTVAKNGDFVGHDTLTIAGFA